LDDLKILITKEEIQRRVAELGKRISRDYGAEEIILVCNLKGAFIFLADLCRNLTSPLSIDFIAVTSYKGTKPTGPVRIIKDLKMDISQKHVLLVEDIVDTGYTLEYIIRYIGIHRPLSVKVCTLLDKKCTRRVEVPIDYVGFEVDDRFVVGYGLDYNERYREMECIAELRPGKGQSE